MEIICTWIFISITCTACVFFILGTKGLKKELIIFLLWNIVIGYLSNSGFFKNTESIPPRMLLVIAPAVLFVFLCYCKRQETIINQGFHLALHSLRLPVELMLHLMFLQNLLPRVMTYEGWNVDIVIGISAIVLLALRIFGIKSSRKFFYYWNLLGIVTLLIVVSIAILSAPSPVQIVSKLHPNIAVLQFPYTLLPSLIVPLAFASHLLLISGFRTKYIHRHIG